MLSAQCKQMHAHQQRSRNPLTCDGGGNGQMSRIAGRRCPDDDGDNDGARRHPFGAGTSSAALRSNRQPDRHQRTAATAMHAAVIDAGAALAFARAAATAAPSTSSETNEYHYIESGGFLARCPAELPAFSWQPPDRIYENLRVLSDRGVVHKEEKPRPPLPPPPPPSASRSFHCTNPFANNTAHFPVATAAATVNRKSYVDTYVLCSANNNSSSDSKHLVQPAAVDENIYENICEICCAIFSGADCDRCSALEESPPDVGQPASESSSLRRPRRHRQLADKVSHFTAGLISSFRSKRPAPGSVGRPAARPTIVHNVDTVFRTNCSFDLAEISRMKQHSSRHQQHASSSFASTASLCRSDDDDDDADHDTVIRHRISSSNPFITLQSVSVDSLLHTSAPSSSSASFASSSSSASSAVSSLRDVRDCRRSHALAVDAWMTSLRRTPIDYDCECDRVEPIAFAVKCMPSVVSFAACSTTIGRTTPTGPRIITNTATRQHKIATRELNTSSSLSSASATAKRRAIYVRDQRNSVAQPHADRKAALQVVAVVRENLLAEAKETATAVSVKSESTVFPQSVCVRSRELRRRHRRTTPRERLTHFFVSALGLNRRLVLTADCLAYELFFVQLRAITPHGQHFPSSLYNLYITFAVAEMAAAEPLQFEPAAEEEPEASSSQPQPIAGTADHPPAIYQRNRHIGMTPPTPAPRNLKPKTAGVSTSGSSATTTESSPLQRQSPVRRKRFGISGSPRLSSPPPAQHRYGRGELPSPTAPTSVEEQLQRRHARLLIDELQQHRQQQRRQCECIEASSTAASAVRSPAATPQTPVPAADEAIYQSIWAFSTVGQGDDGLIEDNRLECAGDSDDDDDRCDTCSMRRVRHNSSSGSSVSGSACSDDADASSPPSTHDATPAGCAEHRWVVSDDFTFTPKSPLGASSVTSSSNLSSLSRTSSDAAAAAAVALSQQNRQRERDLELLAARAAYPFREVLVLISAERKSRNQLVYDLDQRLFESFDCGASESQHSAQSVFTRKGDSDSNNNLPTKSTIDGESASQALLLDDWKRMMRTVDYAEDEEDVVS